MFNVELKYKGKTYYLTEYIERGNENILRTVYVSELGNSIFLDGDSSREFYFLKTSGKLHGDKHYRQRFYLLTEEKVRFVILGKKEKERPTYKDLMINEDNSFYSSTFPPRVWSVAFSPRLKERLILGINELKYIIREKIIYHAS